MAITNVPQIQWLTTGLVVPSEAAVLAGVQADLQAAFGSNLNFTNLQTPQGQLATSITAMISNCYALFAQLVSGVDPAQNESFMQDSIGLIYFQNRIPGTGTVVSGSCLGLAGTVIPAGSPTNPQAQDAAGNLYYCNGGTIPIGGSVNLQFTNVADGPIGLSGALSIYQAVPGWDQITSATQVSLGTNVESPEAFEYRREQSLESNAQGSLQAIYGAVAGLAGVTAVFAIENDTNGTVNYGPTAYPLTANSTYVAVVGGVAAAIGQAIFSKKSPGSPTLGNQSVTVYDTTYPVGQQPAYTVKYNVPNSVPMSCVVTLANSNNLPANYQTLIQNAILALFQNGQQATNGQQAIPPVSIASLLLSANYFTPVLLAVPGIPLLSIQWGTLFTGTGTVTNTSTTLTISAVTSGFLAPGDVVTTADVPTGTYIVQQLSGTPGGNGTYQMSAAATGSPGAGAVSSATGNNTQFQAGIDQIMTLAAANITVVT